MTVRTLAMALLFLAPLAGCMEAGETKEAQLSLSHDGSGSGEHEDSGRCDSDGQVTVAGNIQDGSLHVTVTDGDGQQIYDRTFDNQDEMGSDGVNGKEGEWTLKAVRMQDDVLGDDFNGQYTVTLNC